MERQSRLHGHPLRLGRRSRTIKYSCTQLLWIKVTCPAVMFGSAFPEPQPIPYPLLPAYFRCVRMLHAIHGSHRCFARAWPIRTTTGAPELPAMTSAWYGSPPPRCMCDTHTHTHLGNTAVPTSACPQGRVTPRAPASPSVSCVHTDTCSRVVWKISR